jgi:hypothetical protein
MNFKKIINIVLVCTLLLCACGKENDIDFPVTLYAYEISKVSNIRLFVNKQEIYDLNVIKKFVGDSEYFKLPTNEDIQSSDMSIYFLSKDSVLFGTLTTGFTVEKNATQFLFYSSIMNFINSRDDMVRPLLKYTDELVPVSPITGYDYITSEVRVGYGSYKNLELCFLSYMRLRKKVYNVQDEEHYDIQFNAGRLLNEFNEEAKNIIQERDTLAIQEYRIRFIAK